MRKKSARMKRIIPFFSRISLLLLVSFVAGSGAATATTSSSKEQTTQEDKLIESSVPSPNNAFSTANQYTPPGRLIPNQNKDSISLRSAKTKAQKAASAPIHKKNETKISAFTGKSHRMEEYSLAQQIDYLSEKGNESYFEVLLQMEEARQQQEENMTSIQASSTLSQSRISPTFLSILGSSSLLAVLSWLWDPASARSLWKTVVGKKLRAALAVAWLPFVWAHPGKLALVDLLILIQFVRQPAVLPVLQYEVIPLVWKTVKAMVVAELWSRSWKWFFTQLDQVKQEVMAEIGNKQEDTEKSVEDSLRIGVVKWPTNSPPSWLKKIHALLVGSVRKGIRSSIKKSIQETIMSSLEVWINALRDLVFPPRRKNKFRRFS